MFRLGHESVWWDEAFTWAMTNHSFTGILKRAVYDVHPPLYYLLTKVFRWLAGNSILTIRLLSVLGALALAALGLGPVRRACGPKAGLIYSGLVILTPGIVSAAQDGRMYTWSAFLVTGTVLYAYLAATGGKTGDWIKLGIMTLGAAYIHYYALLAVVIANLLLFIGIIIKKRRRILPFLITMAAVYIGYRPWIDIFIRQYIEVKQSYWIPPVSLSTIWTTLTFPFGDKFYSAPELFVFRPFAFGLACVLILWGLWSVRIKRPPGFSLNILGISVYLLTFLAGIVLSFTIRPVWCERYITIVAGLFILSSAIGLSVIGKKNIFIFVVILVLGFNSAGIYQIYRQRFNGPMREVAAYLKPGLAADAIFVHFDWVTRDSLYYYFPHHKHFVYMPQLAKIYYDPLFFRQSMAGPDLSRFLTEGKDIYWIVKSGAPEEQYNPSTIVASKKITPISGFKAFKLPYSGFGVSVGRFKSSTINAKQKNKR